MPGEVTDVRLRNKSGRLKYLNAMVKILIKIVYLALRRVSWNVYSIWR